MRNAKTVLAGIAAASLWATVVAALQQALQRSQQFATAHGVVFSNQ